MKPHEFRSGGSGASLRFAVGQCSLGAILVASSEKGVAAILLGDDPEALVHELERDFPNAELSGSDPDFERLVATVAGFVDNPSQGIGLPLDIRGTAFQEKVWLALMEIPVGKTMTYSEIAERIGAPGAARAVGAACASNMLAVAIPCHRVVRTDGSLSGYRWGIERKRTLLGRESG
jgi:AraC family transcriptional regulator of adaptative response/methylated-DNA-[protein]-cysteine methyltransferase